MKVQELIYLLEQYDPDADVILGIQPSWPFEHRIRGVVERSEFVEYDDEELAEFDKEEEGDRSASRDSFSTAGKPTDVIICEGGQIRYADRNMFDACER